MWSLIGLGEAELAALVGLEERLWAFLGKSYSHERWEESHFSLELPGKWELSCAAVERGQGLVGFWVCSMPRPGWAHVHRVGVDPRWWGKGIGKEMFAWSSARARAKGARAMSVSVAEANVRARDFYTRLGFSLVDGPELQQWARAHGRRGRVHQDGIYEAGIKYIIMCYGLV